MNDCKVPLLCIFYYFGTNITSLPIPDADHQCLTDSTSSDAQLLMFMLIFFKTAEIGRLSFYFLLKLKQTTFTFKCFPGPMGEKSCALLCDVQILIQSHAGYAFKAVLSAGSHSRSVIVDRAIVLVRNAAILVTIPAPIMTWASCFSRTNVSTAQIAPERVSSNHSAAFSSAAKSSKSPSSAIHSRYDTSGPDKVIVTTNIYHIIV